MESHSSSSRVLCVCVRVMYKWDEKRGTWLPRSMPAAYTRGGLEIFGFFYSLDPPQLSSLSLIFFFELYPRSLYNVFLFYIICKIFFAD